MKTRYYFLTLALVAALAAFFLSRNDRAGSWLGIGKVKIESRVFQPPLLLSSNGTESPLLEPEFKDIVAVWDSRLKATKWDDFSSYNLSETKGNSDKKEERAQFEKVIASGSVRKNTVFSSVVISGKGKRLAFLHFMPSEWVERDRPLPGFPFVAVRCLRYLDGQGWKFDSSLNLSPLAKHMLVAKPKEMEVVSEEMRLKAEQTIADF